MKSVEQRLSKDTFKIDLPGRFLEVLIRSNSSQEFAKSVLMFTMKIAENKYLIFNSTSYKKVNSRTGSQV